MIYLAPRPSITQKRLGALAGFFVILALILGLRLFQKMILQHKTYLAQAKQQYLVHKDMPAKRGTIYVSESTNESSDKFPLATSESQYQILVVPRNVKDPLQASVILADILGQKKEDIYPQINNSKLYIPPLAKRIGEGPATQIQNLNLDGVMVVPEEVRFYPENELAADILGFTNFENDGRYGIEGYYNEELKGYSGSVVAEKDTKGRWINIDGLTEPRNGSDLFLTLDHNVQFFVENELKAAIEKYQADSGSIIVSDPKTGGILAMADWPNFNPNKFNEVKKEDQGIFVNQAIAGAYEPGSIFKPIAMGAALDTGTVEPDTEDVFSNMVVVDGKEIHTAQDKAFGRETMTQVLENSDNVAMVWVMDKVGNENFFKYLQNFGFGQKTGVDLDTESTGNLPALKKWRNIQRATIAFGQGIAVTPMQLVAAYSAIANGGRLIQPHILERMVRSDGRETQIQPKEVRQVLKAETAQKLTGMLVSVVERGHGKKAAVSGYKVAGKTGTAQVPNSAGGYFEDRHIGSFGGFFPADDPRFVMLVRLDNPKNVEWAESSAAPVFGKIAAWILEYYHIPPKAGE